jgi:hypothetical protein
MAGRDDNENPVYNEWVFAVAYRHSGLSRVRGGYMSPRSSRSARLFQISKAIAGAVACVLCSASSLSAQQVQAYCGVYKENPSGKPKREIWA